MNSSVTIRLSALAMTSEKSQATVAPDSSSASGPEASDEALMLQICEGSQDALSPLFRRYARLVRAIAYKILGDESEADDTLQEVFLFIHRKSKLFDSSKSSARSWIVQVTYHRAIDRRRYLQSRHFYTQVDLEDVARELGDDRYKSAIEALEHEGVRRLFEALSENQRQTLQLFFFEGLTFNEIAAKLGQTRGNVKNHYFRGLDKLRKQLLSRSSGRESAV